MTTHLFARVRIGISACLLGQTVRFDAGHKQDAYIKNTLGEYFEYVPFCPEVGIGLGVPRTPIRLVRVGSSATPLALNVKDASLDYTEALQAYLSGVEDKLHDLAGFILKKSSPSCGMERVKVYDHDHPERPPERVGVGIFAKTLQQYFPCLPLEEEGRLTDPVLRENFIERVYIYQRWLNLRTQTMTPSKLVQFHADHKYIVMAHDQAALRVLGQLVARAGKGDDFTQLCEQYISYLMQVLKRPARRGTHVNVLQHLLGYISEQLDNGDRAELVDSIQSYQMGYVPLIVPLTLLKHHFRRHPHPYIERQYYLNPHPGELMLRNQI